MFDRLSAFVMSQFQRLGKRSEIELSFFLTNKLLLPI